jgi:hypothetical protein
MKKLILFSILTLVIIYNNSNAQLVSFPLKVTDGIAVDTLYFGIDPSGTNGLDVSLGENELPPVPPTGVFDARFTGEGLVPPVPIGEGLLKDYRYGTNSIDIVHKFRIKYKVGVGSTILISWWNIPTRVEGRFKDIITGTIIDKNMNTTDSLLITIPSGISILELTVNFLRTDPVELTSFTSAVNDNNVSLNWVTSHESQNAGFGVERKSIEEQSWTEIGFVPGNNNSNENNYYNFNDNNLKAGKYNYRLKQIDLNGNYEYFNLTEIVEIGIPDNFYLSQNYPNPFNPVTTIKFNIPTDGNVKISLYDLKGSYVKNLTEGFRNSGYYEVNFNSEGLPSGTYYYKLETSNGSITKKMMIVK